MSKKKKVIEIIRILNNLYPNPVPPLNHYDPFSLLIAVLLSARCTDERVNQVTPKLFSKGKNANEMSKLEIEEIREIIRPCGLSPTKAKNIKNLSKIICNKFNGDIPKNITELEKLPGVGHKTASVVMSQAFNIPTFPVDTHIHRLAYRWKLSTGKSVEKTELDLKKNFPVEYWNKLHLQIIFYGREFCKARPHIIENCQICTKFGRKAI
ncbi:MAG: endonuclease III [Flavobacteriales bacterium]|nr:endonuclease III [Flavobacteriales bacterium]